MLGVKMPVNYKFRKNRTITEDDRASLNVGIITKEQKAGNQPWLWTHYGVKSVAARLPTSRSTTLLCPNLTCPC